MVVRSRQVFLNGVTIVLCGTADGFAGAAIAWATKVEKNHVMVSLPSNSEVARRITADGRFTVSVLADGQADIARQYGGRSQSDPRPVDRNDLDFDRWGIPFVRDACAQVLCGVVKAIPVSEQILFLSEIEDLVARDDLEPLAYDHVTFFAG